MEIGTKYWAVVGVAIVAGLFIGYAWGNGVLPMSVRPSASALPPLFGSDIRQLSGIVQTVQGDGFQMTDSAAQKARSVQVDSKTVIVRIVQKDPATLQKEIKAMPKATSSTLPTPPSPNFEEKISLSDLKAGDLVTVIADHDVATATTFAATKVEMFPMNNVSVPAPTSTGASR